MTFAVRAALIGFALVAAACAAGPQEAPPAPAPTARAPTSPAPSPAYSPAPPPAPSSPTAPSPGPAPQPFVPSADEVYPNAKQLAADLAQGLTTYDAGDDWDRHLATLVDPEHVDGLRQAAAELYHEDAWSRGRVVYPQLGGLTRDAVSVMTVVEQRVGDLTGIRTEVRTLDVRLRLEDGAWAFDGLASAGGSPVEPPGDLSAAARAVLDHPGIDLPDSAVWDIYEGRISETLLEVMARAADHTPYGVVVLQTGHPWEIFGTDRQSDHTRGRAVDIHRVGDRHVVDDRQEGSVTHQLVRWLYDQPEVARIGSPWALDGFGGRSWTDDLHQDHLHVAVAE